MSVPWKAWHGDETYELIFPASWEVKWCPMADAPPASESEIQQALSCPIACPPLEVVARGRKRVAIAVDDLTRPTPTRQILPFVLERLNSAGITAKQITIVLALGSHPPLTTSELMTKLGGEVIRDYKVVQHSASQNVCDIGIAFDGIPVKVNKDFFEADLKLSMGGITPHPFAGFSGGGKLILPGLANMEIIERTHRYVVMGFRGGLGVIEGNQFREEVEQVCRKFGVDMIIDVVVNRTREIAGVFVGDVQEAFLKGVDFARKIYRTPVPTALDVAVLNAYPKDTDLVQSENALNILRSTPQPFIKEYGKIVLMTASSHGVGMHGLFAPGGRLYHKPIRKRWLREKGLILYAPNVSAAGARSLFWEGYPFCQTWQEVLEELQRDFSDQCCRVGVFPCSSVQLGEIV